MRWPNIDPKIDISTSSGLLRVTVKRRSWLVFLFEGGVILFIAEMTYRGWANLSHMFRVLSVWAIVSAIAALIFQWSGTEIIEFSSGRLTIRKEIRGWERRRDYSVKECHELEWIQGAEDLPTRLQCKTDRGTITFGESLTEDQAMQIVGALQESLPEVARQLCSYPGSKKHFITLDLS